MALFIVKATDREGSLDLRMETRPAHIDWARSLGDRVKLAGPLLAGDGETPCGSVFLIEAANFAEARTLFDSDPYVKAGLFDQMDIQPFRASIGTWMPPKD